MTFYPDSTPPARLAPPQANPSHAPETVCQRTQWVDEVEAYVADLRARLDVMMRRT